MVHFDDSHLEFKDAKDKVDQSKSPSSSLTTRVANIAEKILEKNSDIRTLESFHRDLTEVKLKARESFQGTLVGRFLTTILPKEIANFFSERLSGEKRIQGTIDKIVNLISDYEQQNPTQMTEHRMLEEHNFALPAKNLPGFQLVPDLESQTAERLGLEGGIISASLRAIANDLDAFQQEIPDAEERSKIQEAKETLEKGKELESQFSRDAHEQKIKEQISNLKEGKSLIIPAGSKGHSILIKIAREGPNNYIFEIINTGEGAHTIVGKGAGSLKATSFRIINCTLEQISDPQFIKKILDAKAGAKNTDELYATIKQSLLSDEQRVEFKEDRYPLQTRGSCSYDCIMAYLKGAMPRKLYRKFQYFIAKTHSKKLFLLTFGRTTEDRKLLEESHKKTYAKLEGRVKKWESR